MNKEFVNWLNEELGLRGWSNSHIARLMGVVPSTVSMVISEKTPPTWDFCLGVGQALGKAPEDVFRIAGLLPPVPDPDGVRALTDFAKHLSVEDIEEVTAYARFRYERAKGHR